VFQSDGIGQRFASGALAPLLLALDDADILLDANLGELVQDLRHIRRGDGAVQVSSDDKEAIRRDEGTVACAVRQVDDDRVLVGVTSRRYQPRVHDRDRQRERVLNVRRERCKGHSFRVCSPGRGCEVPEVCCAIVREILNTQVPVDLEDLEDPGLSLGGPYPRYGKVRLVDGVIVNSTRNA